MRVSMPDGGVVLLLEIVTLIDRPFWVKLIEVIFLPTTLSMPS